MRNGNNAQVYHFYVFITFVYNLYACCAGMLITTMKRKEETFFIH